MKLSAISLFTFLSVLPTVFSAPIQHDRSHALERRLTVPSPAFVLYWDAFVPGETGPPPPSDIEGFNVFILSFLLAAGPADQAETWVLLSGDQRAAIKAEYNAAGISLMVSAFGSTDQPTTQGLDPIATANSMAAFVKEFDLDGIDVDYEDFDAMNAQDGKAEAWLNDFTRQLRLNLPVGQYLLTHAPVAPWFSQEIYASGAYFAVNKAVGDLIDWYNIQFYNQGEYTTCDGLLTASSSTFPDSAVFQIHTVQDVDLSKIVIGKPANTGDANNGFMTPSTLAGCVSQANDAGWAAGVMTFQYPHADKSWISIVRGSTFPIGSAPVPPVSTHTSPTTPAPTTIPATPTTKPATPTTKPATTTTKPTLTIPKTPTSTATPSMPASGKCSGVAPWSSATAYTSGAQVISSNHLWTAEQWTEADTPGGAAGVWTDNGSC